MNRLVCINTKNSTVTTLADGADFYSFPTINSDGSRLAFIQWQHPNMPWEAAELYSIDIIATDSDISFNGKLTLVAGGSEESVSQPIWATDDILVFLSDESGFSNPLTFDAKDGSIAPVLKSPLPYDFGEPDWRLGDYRIAALNSSTLVVAPTIDSVTHLSLLDIPSGKLTPIASPYVNISKLKRVSKTQVAFVSAEEVKASALILATLGGSPAAATFKVLKETSNLSSLFPAELIAPDVSITLPNPDSANPLHVLLASPKNPEYDPKGARNGELPPCIILVHGGPTARTPPGLSWMTQFFTSRGWAL